VGRLGDGRAITPQFRAQVIDGDEENIGTFLRCQRQERSNKTKEEKEAFHGVFSLGFT
jgi:hypothetical protein